MTIDFYPPKPPEKPTPAKEHLSLDDGFKWVTTILAILFVIAVAGWFAAEIDNQLLQQEIQRIQQHRSN